MLEYLFNIYLTICCVHAAWWVQSMAMSTPTTFFSFVAVPFIHANQATCLRSCKDDYPFGWSWKAWVERYCTILLICQLLVLSRFWNGSCCILLVSASPHSETLRDGWLIFCRIRCFLHLIQKINLISPSPVDVLFLHLLLLKYATVNFCVICLVILFCRICIGYWLNRRQIWFDSSNYWWRRRTSIWYSQMMPSKNLP